MPVDEGLIYIQPVYAQKTESASAYPILTYVLVSYDGQVGIGKSLALALADALGVTDTTTPDPDHRSRHHDAHGHRRPADQPALQQADTAFTAADAALAKGDLAEYQTQVNKAQDLISTALSLDDNRPGGGNGASADPSGSA